MSTNSISAVVMHSGFHLAGHLQGVVRVYKMEDARLLRHADYESSTGERRTKMSLGHHPDRCTDRPGVPVDWDTHQEIHRGERDVLGELGIRKDAFDRGFGNTVNPDNLPPRRPYGHNQY